MNPYMQLIRSRASMMLEIVNDPLLQSIYPLFSGHGIQQCQIFNPDPFLPKSARCVANELTAD
jgi:hypothetical protein